MYRYQNNAFRVIGLTSDASMKVITQRVNEIKVKKSLDVDVSYELDFAWMGSIDRSEQNVIKALQRLENPISRLKEEIFWFWLDTKEDKEAFNYLVEGNRQASHEVWKSVIASRIRDDKTSALVNQMILSHSSVIGKEIDVKYKEEVYTKGVCPKCKMQFGHEYRFCIECGDKLKEIRVENASERKRNVTLSDTHWNNWRFAINRITQISQNESFWKKIKTKAKKINDPRLSTSSIQEIRDNFLSDITNPNFRFLSQSLVSKDYERTKQHASLLNGSSFSYEYLRKGFNEILASHITLIDRHCHSSSKEIVELDESARKTIKAIVDVYSKLEKNVSGTIAEGNLIDFNCISDYGLARDKLANSVKNIAITLNNFLVADKIAPPKQREWGYQKAHEMVKMAREHAGSQYTRQKFAKDEELVKSNMEIERLNRSYYERGTTNQSSSRPTSYTSSAKPSAGFNWKPILGWIVFIGFIFIVSYLSEDSSNTNTSTRSSSYKSQTTGSSTSLSQLKSRIDTLAASINQKRDKILEIEEILKPKASRLDTLKTDIKNLESRINSTWFGKDKLTDEYNQKVNEHNSLLQSYNSQYYEYERLFKEMEAEIATHDGLVKTYNSRIR